MGNQRLIIDFIGVGAEKAGTTWLADQLAAHPEICMSVPKEVFYFNERNNYTYTQQYNQHFKRNRLWYEKHWAHCQDKNKIKGEFSTAYLYDKKAAKKIYELYPDAKIIVGLRNPIERAYSAYRWHVDYTRKERRSFREVLKHEKEYIEKGLYAQQIKRFLRYFSKEQLFIVTLDEIKSDPEKTVSKLYDFLGVDNSFVPKSIFSSSNPARYMRFPGVMELVNKFFDWLDQYPNSSKIRAMIEREWLKKLIKKIITRKSKKPGIKPENRRLLAQAFYNDVRELETLLNKDLSFWLEE